jgi:hypothetical protein
MSEDLISNCAGVLFLGTPHKGTSTFATHGELLVAITLAAASAENSNFAVEEDILLDLRSAGDGLTTISQEFCMLSTSRNLNIKCFHEGRRSNISRLVDNLEIPPVSLNTLKPTLTDKQFVVSQSSATLDGYDSIELTTDHFQLNKFDDPEDGNYKLVVGTLGECYSDWLNRSMSTIRGMLPLFTVIH